jgi:proteasome lid subunit RPN8/RPN11
MTIALPESVREAIVEHARDGAPAEVVGLLAGGFGEERSTVQESHPATNVAATPRTRHEVAPPEELALLERIDETGLDVVGFYHSHPESPATPSETDARLAAWSGYSHVIVSLQDEPPTFGSWRWTGERFERESIVTTG